MKRTDLGRRVLADCYCRLQPSPIHGVGVYAVRDIPKGKNPFQTLRKYARPAVVRLTDDELARLPAGLPNLIKALFVGSDGNVHVPTCGTNLVYLVSYLNHSPDPNLRTSDGFSFRTNRRILQGEELTVDYRTYGADALLALP